MEKEAEGDAVLAIRCDNMDNWGNWAVAYNWKAVSELMDGR